jgi:hypothetical protein
MKAFWWGLLGLLVLSFLLSSCVPGTDLPTRVLPVNSGQAIDSEASRGITFVTELQTPEGKREVRLCNFSAQVANEGSASLTANIKDVVQLEGKAAEKIIDLVKRSQTLGLLQEMSDLICILVNFSGTTFAPDEVKEIFAKLLDATVTLAQAELEQAQAQNTEAQAAKAEAVMKRNESALEFFATLSEANLLPTGAGSRGAELQNIEPLYESLPPEQQQLLDQLREQGLLGQLEEAIVTPLTPEKFLELMRLLLSPDGAGE